MSSYNRFRAQEGSQGMLLSNSTHIKWLPSFQPQFRAGEYPKVAEKDFREACFEQF